MDSHGGTLMRRQFLSLQTFDDTALTAFVMRTLTLKKAFQKGEKIGCQAVPVANLFFEASTRTRTSFELAQRRLGLSATSLAIANSSVSKGETLRDTVMNLHAMGTRAFVVRHPSSGAVEYLAKRCDAHFVNAGDGLHEHPTQGLLDLVTLWEQWGSVKGKTIAIIGDLRHSRVARSNLHSLPKLGAHVNLFGPPTLVPRQLAEGQERVRLCHDFAEAVSEADAVMVLRIQKERMTQGFLPSLSDYTRGFGLTKQRAELLKQGALILHPGPINRGVEIDDAVADSERSVILKQVENGVFARMAVLQWLLEDVAS
jgi:aspartate carbamoyltransferase catalytic subunit